MRVLDILQVKAQLGQHTEKTEEEVPMKLHINLAR
jgi:hypothetical protein